MKISVVTAVYNREATIGQALDSVLSQTGVDLEVIVQDGASTDNTLQEIRSFNDPRVTLTSEPDDGLYDAINRGIAQARGDVVGLLHSDDYLANARVLRAVAQAFEDPNIDGVYGDLEYVSSVDPSHVIRHWRSGEYTRRKLAWGWMPPHPTLYLRRSVYEQWGGYDTAFWISADYEAMLRYLVKGQIRLGYIPDVLVKMRTGGASNRSLGNILRKSREDLSAIRRHRIGDVGTLLGKNFRKLNQFVLPNQAQAT